MSAAGAAAASPVGQPQQPAFGGQRPRYWIRRMDGRSAQVQAPDGTVSELPTSHMPRGSAPGGYLDEQAFMAGHQQRQAAAQARNPFVQQLAAPTTQQQAVTSPAVASPSAVSAAPLPAPPPPVTATPVAGTVASAPVPLSAPAPAGANGYSQATIDKAKSDAARGVFDYSSVLPGQPPPWMAGGQTAALNAAQQQFTANNGLYGITGYLGNDQQVASQVAGGAQANSIPLGVLGSTFSRGGSDSGGQQTSENSLSGNNGATDWTGSTYGVSPAAYIPALATTLRDRNTALSGSQAGPGGTTASVGAFTTAVPGQLRAQADRQAAFQAQLAAASQPFDPAQYQAAPAAASNAPEYAAVATPATVQPATTATANQVGPASRSVDYTPPAQPAIQPTGAADGSAPGAVVGGGYTPPAAASNTDLVTTGGSTLSPSQVTNAFRQQLAGSAPIGASGVRRTLSALTTPRF